MLVYTKCSHSYNALNTKHRQGSECGKKSKICYLIPFYPRESWLIVPSLLTLSQNVSGESPGMTLITNTFTTQQTHIIYHSIYVLHTKPIMCYLSHFLRNTYNVLGVHFERKGRSRGHWLSVSLTLLELVRGLGVWVRTSKSVLSSSLAPPLVHPSLKSNTPSLWRSKQCYL